MVKQTFRVLASFLLLVFSLSAMAADSPRDMLAAGRADDAIAALNQRVASNPKDAEAFNLLCRAYFQYEDWDRAESRCKRATELDPNNSRFHRWLGRVYGVKAGRANILSAAGLAIKARDEFQRAAQLDPRDADALVDVAEYYIEAPGIMGGGVDKAREQAKVLGKVSPAQEHWVYARIAEKNPHAAYRCWLLAQISYLAGNERLCKREVKHLEGNPEYGAEAAKLGQNLSAAKK